MNWLPPGPARGRAGGLRRRVEAPGGGGGGACAWERYGQCCWPQFQPTATLQLTIHTHPRLDMGWMLITAVCTKAAPALLHKMMALSATHCCPTPIRNPCRVCGYHSCCARFSGLSKMPVATVLPVLCHVWVVESQTLFHRAGHICATETRG